MGFAYLMYSIPEQVPRYDLVFVTDNVKARCQISEIPSCQPLILSDGRCLGKLNESKQPRHYCHPLLAGSQSQCFLWLQGWGDIQSCLSNTKMNRPTSTVSTTEITKAFNNIGDPTLTYWGVKEACHQNNIWWVEGSSVSQQQQTGLLRQMSSISP